MSHPVDEGHEGVAHLSEEFLNTLVAELDEPDTVGIVLGGSYARGEANQFSDVDLACFAKDEAEPRRKWFLYREERLVSVATKTVAGVRAEMSRPERAIWVVPGIGNCRILLDKTGSVARLTEEIAAFRWEPLQSDADRYASYSVVMAAEQVHKIVAELTRRDELALSYAVSKLFQWLTEAVAVQKGVMVKSDNTYYRQVQEAAGADTPWTYYHTLCASEGTARTRGIAVLRLYCETVELLRPVMKPDHVRVVEQAVGIARYASDGNALPLVL